MNYQGAEWHEAVKEASLTETVYKSRSAGWFYRWQNLILGCPNGMDKLVTWEVRNSAIVSVILEEKPTPSDYIDQKFDRGKFKARFRAPYDVFIRLHKQEVTAMVAIGSGEYIIDGDVTDVMKNIDYIDAFIDLTALVPANYD